MLDPTAYLIAIIVGTVTYIGSRYLERSVFAPRLKVKYSDMHNNYITYSYDEFGRDYKGYLRLKVVNNALAIAKACRVFLVGIEKKENGIFKRTKFNETLLLAWSYGVG